MKDVYVSHGQSVNFSAILLFVMDHNLAINSTAFIPLVHVVKQTIQILIATPK